MNVIWSPEARAFVRAEVEKIASERPQAAQHWLMRLHAAVDRVALFPGSGRRVPEVRRVSVREVIVGKYRVIYFAEPERITIVTVCHSRESLASAFVVPLEAVNE